MTLRDSLSRPVLLALAAATAAGFAARDASADMVQTNDGKWWPDTEEIRDARLGPDDEPGDDLLKITDDYKVTAEYDFVKLSKGGFNKPAAQVRKILTTERATNQAFRQALIEASGLYFIAAAEGFAAAAAELSGGGKHEALFRCQQAWAAAGDADKAKAAADALEQAFPKTFWLYDAHLLRGKINLGALDKHMDAVKNAPGMNVRDVLRSEYSRILFTKEFQRKWDAAKTDYEKLADAADKAGADGAQVKQQALGGVGNCLLGAGKHSEAEAFFRRAVADARDPDVLASAYAGLGDVNLTAAKGLRDAKKLEEAKAKLEEASLHYLRVTLLYKDAVEEPAPVLRSYENQAKVFVALFDMSNGKDCEAAKRAYASYRELVDMMQDGPPRRTVIREANEFLKRREAAGCK